MSCLTKEETTPTELRGITSGLAVDSKVDETATVVVDSTVDEDSTSVVVETDAKVDDSSTVVVSSRVDETASVVVDSMVDEDSASVVVDSTIDETSASVVVDSTIDETSASVVVETEAKVDETSSTAVAFGLSIIELKVDKIPEKTESKVDTAGSEDAELDDVTTSSATTLTVQKNKKHKTKHIPSNLPNFFIIPPPFDFSITLKF